MLVEMEENSEWIFINLRTLRLLEMAMYILSSLFTYDTKKNKEGEKLHRRVNVFQKWNINLPAGLFSVVSSLNEYICFIFVTHWLGKGGIMGSMSPHPWFLLLKIKMRCCKVMLRVWQYREHTLHGCLIYVIQQLWPKLNGHKSYSGHRLLLLISILSFLLSTRIWNIPNFTNAFHVSNFNISAIQYSTIPDILNTIVYKYRTFLFWNLSAYKAPTKP